MMVVVEGCHGVEMNKHGARTHCGPSASCPSPPLFPMPFLYLNSTAVHFLSLFTTVTFSVEGIGGLVEYCDSWWVYQCIITVPNEEQGSVPAHQGA